MCYRERKGVTESERAPTCHVSRTIGVHTVTPSVDGGAGHKRGRNHLSRKFQL
ncbi:hypothetical protein HanXRQr2_Chr08g0334511 [Helianthus annuus]|uniref:Uncharacterized protein n=1 Tax=Helianthus annuus TaxID=4232 RepID=A0A251U5G5_HELAN|nr:hypothetical protein HanXRQr2_Chr08g0334511 [Helianthus annuus]